MKTFFLGLIFVFMGLIFAACSDDEAQHKKILARINDYDLTLSEFNADLDAELEMQPEVKVTPQAKKEFLESIIERELLIQEAKKRGLDRRKKFIRAIERYWESTLIRDLLEIKGKEISEQISISEGELAERLKEIEKSQKAAKNPEAAKQKAMKALKNEKRRQILREWITDLRKSAKVEINQNLLSQ